jgi:hypothetical protein
MVGARRHIEALRAQDLRFEQERDRRYSEVKEEQEKAIKIKETADLAALELAREIQTYKDEKANELREQISSERGLYATKDDLAGAIEKVQAERRTGGLDSRALVYGVLFLLLTLGAIISPHIG